MCSPLVFILRLITNFDQSVLLYNTKVNAGKIQINRYHNARFAMKSIYKKVKKHKAKNNRNSLISVLKKSDLRFLIWYTAFALLVTIVYWANGGKSIFVFPTILCVGLVVRNLRRPASQFFNNGSRVLPIKHSQSARK